MDLIPAIDIIDGKCVRLTKGDYASKKIYHEDPVQVAQQFQDAGIEKLHLVDLDGARSERVVNLEILHQISTHTTMEIDFGGGIKRLSDLELVFQAGAKQVTGGSIAARDRDEFITWIDSFGSDKIILGADALNMKIMVQGWQESTDLDLLEYLDFYIRKGIKTVICTDISRDGMLTGPSIDLYKEIINQYVGIQLIASGGIRNMNDLYILRDSGLAGAIFGKAFYEGIITLKELEAYAD